MFCPRCGAPLAAAGRCSSCGAPPAHAPAAVDVATLDTTGLPAGTTSRAVGNAGFGATAGPTGLPTLGGGVIARERVTREEGQRVTRSCVPVRLQKEQE